MAMVWSLYIRLMSYTTHSMQRPLVCLSHLGNGSHLATASLLQSVTQLLQIATVRTKGKKALKIWTWGSSNNHLFPKLLAKHGKPNLPPFDTTDGYRTCFKLSWDHSIFRALHFPTPLKRRTISVRFEWTLLELWIYVSWKYYFRAQLNLRAPTLGAPTGGRSTIG